MTKERYDVVVIGAGIAGIATAYYLCRDNRSCRVLLVDCRTPMSFTSAQSGDNYRNWWPHSTMTAFTNDSIDEIERIAQDSDNVIQMTHGGYVLATRQTNAEAITKTISGDIDVAVVEDQAALKKTYPSLSGDIRAVVHIRRGGDLSGQQLGQYMLEKIRDAGGRRVTARVVGIDKSIDYVITLDSDMGSARAANVVNAAGPFVNDIAAMLGQPLPVSNLFQQKIAFEDVRGAIPRDMPFTIDLDSKHLDWTTEESEMLAEDDSLVWLTKALPSGTHCRPEGGPKSQWLKLGWAYNQQRSDPVEDLAAEPAIDSSFPEIVLRGASQLLPALAPYVESPPTRIHHYGGYYTMTDENWPLIGPLDGDGAYIVGALSGFGSMAACAAGKLCAAHVRGAALPGYAADLSLARYDNNELMSKLADSANRGIL